MRPRGLKRRRACYLLHLHLAKPDKLHSVYSHDTHAVVVRNF